MADSTARSKVICVSAKKPSTAMGSCSTASVAPTENFHWKRMTTYRPMNSRVMISAVAPFSASSRPTCGPIASVRRISTAGSMLASAAVACSVMSSACWPSAGGSFTSMSRAVPKLCTCADPRPAAPSAERVRSMSAGSVKAASIRMPPVKSMPKLRPRTATSSNELMIKKAEKMYQ